MTEGGLESKCFLVYRDYILTNLLFFPHPSGGVVWGGEILQWRTEWKVKELTRVQLLGILSR